MWVCGGEIVAAPNAQVAHMWRTGDRKTSARYKHVGDTLKNRARAINAWFGDFSAKLDDFPSFHDRKKSGGEHWFGDMTTFQNVKDKLQGCRPFAWYLRRFKAIYEDAGIIPSDIFMIREEKSMRCLFFQGHAGTSGSGKESVSLKECDENNPRMFWHLGNSNPRDKTCCSGLRAWNTEQCFQGKAGTGICEISGRHTLQAWQLDENGALKQRDKCIGSENGNALKEAPCVSWRNKEGGRWTKQATRVPLETKLYNDARRDHPEVFAKLELELKALAGIGSGPSACQEGNCVTLIFADGTGRCVDDEGSLSKDKSACAIVIVGNGHVKKAENGNCLDTWSDDSIETWGWYDCHDGSNQKFAEEGPVRVCSAVDERACFLREKWAPPR